jgi:hypothetical protein
MTDRIPALDGLRAVAILLVIASHSIDHGNDWATIFDVLELPNVVAARRQHAPIPGDVLSIETHRHMDATGQVSTVWR